MLLLFVADYFLVATYLCKIVLWSMVFTERYIRSHPPQDAEIIRDRESLACSQLFKIPYIQNNP